MVFVLTFTFFICFAYCLVLGFFSILGKGGGGGEEIEMGGGGGVGVARVKKPHSLRNLGSVFHILG